MLGASLASQAADTQSGKYLFQYCMPCHGDQGEGKQFDTLHIPAIGGLEAWYVETQLNNFQEGIRGAHPQDTKGLLMRPMSRLLLSDANQTSEQKIKEVAAYVASLPAAKGEKTVEGNLESGKYYYEAMCSACHGQKFDGNIDPNNRGPAQRPLNDWYMIEQLKKFSTGIRGKDPRDLGGAKMRPLIKDTLPQVAAVKNESLDQAITNVVAYIYSGSRNMLPAKTQAAVQE